MSGHHCVNHHDRLRRLRILLMIAEHRFGERSPEADKVSHVIAWWQTKPEAPEADMTDEQVRALIDDAYNEVEAKREACRQIYQIISATPNRIAAKFTSNSTKSGEGASHGNR